MRFQSMAAWTPQTMAMQIEHETTHHSSLRAWADAACAEFYARTEVHDRGEGGCTPGTRYHGCHAPNN